MAHTGLTEGVPVYDRASRRIGVLDHVVTDEATGIFKGVPIHTLPLPGRHLYATRIFVGWLLVFAGALYVVDAFSTRDGRRIALRLLIAALSVAAGVYLLVAPLNGAFTLTVVLSMWFLAVSVARIATGMPIARSPAPGCSCSTVCCRWCWAC